MKTPPPIGGNDMTTTTTIKCNNKPRHVLHWFELSLKEQAEFDYLDTDDLRMEATFF
jgi:hypothetical protein